MKNIPKMRGVLAVAAAALMAFAGVASATTVTSPKGTLYTNTIAAESTHSVWHNKTLGVSTTCTESKIAGKVESHGAGIPASGKISSLTFKNCGTSHVTVENGGSLKIEGKTLFSNEAKVTIQNTTVGISCTYTTSNTHIGTLTTSDETGGHAILDIQSAIIPRKVHSSFCGDEGTWTGSYTVTTPSRLYID